MLVSILPGAPFGGRVNCDSGLYAAGMDDFVVSGRTRVHV